MNKTQKNADKVKREVLQGIVLQGDYEIVKEIQEDGAAVYYHPNFLGSPEPVSGESLYEIVRMPILRIKALVELLDDNDWNRFGFIAESITEEAERLYEEMFYFLDKAVGKIEIDVMDRGSIVYRTGRVLGARIIPAER